MGTDYDILSKKILDLDPKVRFAGVANNRGELIAGGQREDVETLLAENDVQMSIHYALQKRDLNTNLAYRIGAETSSITEYEKVTLITIPTSSSELFLVSTEPRADYLRIVDAVRSEFGMSDS